MNKINEFSYSDDHIANLLNTPPSLVILLVPWGDGSQEPETPEGPPNSEGAGNVST